MAAHANPLLDFASPAAALAERDVRGKPESAIAKLAILHAEAEETSRLANLLGRSLHAAIAIPLAAMVPISLSADIGAAPRVAWAVLIIVASLAIARTYANTIGRPFERVALHSFANDLTAVLLFSGIAWGAGAFLVLPQSAPVGSALVFAVAPALGLGLLLRDRRAILLFLAPAAALTAFACVLRPFSAGTLNAVLVLIACAILAAALTVIDRRDAASKAQSAALGLLDA